MTTDIQRKASDFHWFRRLWHFLGVMAMAALYWPRSQPQALILALWISAVLVVMDLLRLFIPPLNKQLTFLFRPFLRTCEVHRLTAASSMLVGVTLIVALFPKNVVLLSLLMLGIADPIAAVFGIRFGKDRLIGSKTLQGSIAAFLVCTLICLGYFSYFHLFNDRLLLASLLGGCIGAVAELVPVFKCDDNLTFPIISSTLIYGMFYLFGAL